MDKLCNKHCRRFVRLVICRYPLFTSSVFNMMPPDIKISDFVYLNSILYAVERIPFIPRANMLIDSFTDRLRTIPILIDSPQIPYHRIMHTIHGFQTHKFKRASTLRWHGKVQRIMRAWSWQPRSKAAHWTTAYQEDMFVRDFRSIRNGDKALNYVSGTWETGSRVEYVKTTCTPPLPSLSRRTVEFNGNNAAHFMQIDSSAYYCESCTNLCWFLADLFWGGAHICNRLVIFEIYQVQVCLYLGCRKGRNFASGIRRD